LLRDVAVAGALGATLLACSAACSDTADASAGTGPAAAGETPPVARLSNAQGDVRYRAARTAAWEPAAVRQALEPADSVQTMERASAAVQFARNGALARLGPSTTLRIPQQPPEVARISHLSGRLVARVDRSEGATRMEVEVPPGTLVLSVADEGAGSVEAELDVTRSRTEIAVTEGRAQLDRRHGEPVRIEARHFVALSSEGEVVDSGRLGEAPAPVSPGDGAEARTRDRVSFAWEPVDGAAGYRLALVGPDGEERTLDVAGTRASAELETGRWTWTVRALIDGERLRASAQRHVDVVLDRAPPRLVLTSPRADEVVTASAVRVAGVTEPGARIEVDGHPVGVGSDGQFETRLPIAPGLVNIVVRATDGVGNERLISRSVLRQ
jgi:hypothetical protein